MGFVKNKASVRCSKSRTTATPMTAELIRMPSNRNMTALMVAIVVVALSLIAPPAKPLTISVVTAAKLMPKSRAKKIYVAGRLRRYRNSKRKMDNQFMELVT